MSDADVLHERVEQPVQRLADDAAVALQMRGAPGGAAVPPVPS